MNGADAWLQAQRSRVTAGFAAEGNFGRALGRGEHKANVNLNSTARALGSEGGCDRGFWFVVGCEASRRRGCATLASKQTFWPFTRTRLAARNSEVTAVGHTTGQATTTQQFSVGAADGGRVCRLHRAARQAARRQAARKIQRNEEKKSRKKSRW